MSWLSPNGTVSNFSFCNVKIWTLSDNSLLSSSVSKLEAFVKSGFDLTEGSWVRGEAWALSSFLNLKELVLKFGDPFSGVELRVVSLRKLISELHSSGWKLFLRLQNNLEMLRVKRVLLREMYIYAFNSKWNQTWRKHWICCLCCVSECLFLLRMNIQMWENPFSGSYW